MSIRDLIPWNWGKKDVPVKRKEMEDPFRELQRRMNHLFDDFWSDSGLAPTHLPAFGDLGDFAPSIDVKDSDKELTVRAELPGMTENDIEVRLDNGVLTVRGEKKEEKNEEKDGMRYTECSYGSFHRAVPLPCEVEEDQVDAQFRNGVLTVTLPKTAEAREQTRRIEVKHG